MSANRAQPAGFDRSGPHIVYFRNPNVMVTSRQVWTRSQRYQVAQLSQVGHARGPAHPGAVMGLVIAAVEVPCGALLLTVAHSPVPWLVAVPALLVPCLVGVYCARRWPAPYELLARYRGEQVILFATRNVREFGQVARALRRAIEEAGGGGGW